MSRSHSSKYYSDQKANKWITRTVIIRKLLQAADEPLPAIGDQKAGRSQVGCKIRHELRKEYGERVRMDFANRSAGSKRVLPTQPGKMPCVGLAY